MEIILFIGSALLSVIALIVNTLLNWFMPKAKPNYPAIRNKLLIKSASELVIELRERKVTSKEIVEAYIERVKEVNPSINAVIENRFTEALKEAEHADRLISKANNEQLPLLYARFPLLGIPFSVKESCAVRGMSYIVGNVDRMQERANQDCEVVEHLREAGAIPLLVSATPEFCLAFETNTETHGRCRNPYDLNRTSAGSSGGEGALNGAGATLFGLGSDIAGSIRLPAMFCGVYGHKPTGGLLSVKGHFPNSTVDPEFPNYLQTGPITRFARDLPLLMHVMAGKNSEKLRFMEGFQTKNIKIHYAYGFGGLNAFRHPPIAFDIKLAIMRAVKFFEKGGLFTEEVNINSFQNSLEVALSGLLSIKGVPSVLTNSDTAKPSKRLLTLEFLRSLFGHSIYTKEALLMELMTDFPLLMSKAKKEKWLKEAENIKKELINLLGVNGVLLFPTYHTPAICFNTSVVNLVGIDMMLLFNILGFPSTQVPLGLDHRGQPVGFQIIAAPYQDRLGIQIAMELEMAFGGWEPPVRHEF